MQEITPEKERKEPVFKKEGIRERAAEELYEKKEEKPEEKEVLLEREKIIRERLEKEIAETKLSPELEKEAKKKAEEIKTLDEKGKLQHLLGLAREKGPVFALKVTGDMKDHYMLDTLHDALIKDELYKKLEK